MFLTDSDYATLIRPEDLDVAHDSTPTNREQAEKMAQAEISSALRSRYDVEAVFIAKGEDRNAEVVMWMLDIALYHMHARMSKRMGMETRKERYDSVKATLRQVAKGWHTPDLPLLNGDTGHPIRFNSEPKLNHSW